MNIIKTTISLLFILCLGVNINGQITNRWTAPDVDISISISEPPNICNGIPAILECDQDFLSYRWEDEDGNIVGTEKEFSTSESGTYTLIVENYTNTTLCEYEMEYTVETSTDMSEFDDYPTFINVYEPTDEVIDPPMKGITHTDCDLVCRDTYNGQYGMHNICYKPYTVYSYKQDGLCSIDGENPIQDLLNILLEESNGSEDVLVVTTYQNDFDNCCTLKDEIESELEDYPIYLWLHIEDLEGGGTSTTFICQDPSGNCDGLAPPFNDLYMGALPNLGFVNPSLLVHNGEFMTPNQSTISLENTGIKDYAKLSETFRDVIRHNVAVAKSRWDMDVEYVLSAECVTYIDGIPSAQQAELAYNDSNADLTVWFHVGPDGNVAFDAKIGDYTPDSKIINDPEFNGATTIAEFNNTLKEAITETLTREKSDIDNISQSTDGVIEELDDPSMWQFGIRQETDDREVTAFGLVKEVGGIGLGIYKEGQLPRKIWKVLGEEETSMLVMPAALAGVGSGIIENNPVVGAIQLGGLAKDICTDQETRDAIVAAGKDLPGTAYHIYQTTWDELSGANGEDEQQHGIGKAGISIVFAAGTFVTIVETLENGGKRLQKNLKDMGDILKDTGGEFTLSGGKKLWKYNDETIFELKNSKILPNEKKHYHQGDGDTQIGEPRDGYQVVKVGDDVKVKRKPNTSEYDNTPYYDKLVHEKGHTLERHGHDVTDDALIKRANEGIAPDGSTINANPPYTKPPYSSKFDSPDAIKHAYDNTKPGSSAFESTLEVPTGFKEVPFVRTDGSIYGKGVKRNTETFENFIKVRARYKKNNTTGQWELTTMFPDI